MSLFDRSSARLVTPLIDACVTAPAIFNNYRAGLANR
jgi:hypothetical protein